MDQENKDMTLIYIWSIVSLSAHVSYINSRNSLRPSDAYMRQ